MPTNSPRSPGANRRTLLWALCFLVIGILAWAPWITPEYAIQKTRSEKTFQVQHQADPDPEIYVTWLPFGRWVTTYEGGWFVSFLGF